MISWCYPIVFWGLAASLLIKFVQLQLADKGPRWLPLIGLAMAIIPVYGIPIGRWMHGVTGGFSIPLFAVMFNTLWSQMAGRHLLSQSNRMAMCVAGAVIGVTLYPLAIGVGPFDPYVLGWSSITLSSVFVIITCALLWNENAIGYVLLFSALAWQVGLLESTNTWDYVIDPVLSLGSLATLIYHAIRKLTVTAHRVETVKESDQGVPELRKAA